MTPLIKRAEYLDGYRIEIEFADGVQGVVDLEEELWGEVFEPLKDLTLFCRFTVDPELATLVWPTGADLAPEYLYERAAA